MDPVGRKNTKPVVHFVEDERGFVLNKGNGAILARAFGDDTDNWEGRTITLFSTWEENQRTGHEPSYADVKGRVAKEEYASVSSDVSRFMRDLDDEIPC